MKCTVCESSSKKVVDDVYDDRYGFNQNFNLYRCQTCAHLFIKTGFDSKQIANLYKDFYPRDEYKIENHKPFKKISRHKELYNPFRHVRPNTKVLDIGCGSCEVLGYLKSIECEAHGVEIDENVKKISDKYGYNVIYGEFNPQNYNINYFDYIILNQVIEHVYDLEQLLCNLSKVLKPDGQVIFSTPNPYGWGAKFFSRYWINWHVPYHVNFFSRKSIYRLSKSSGFKIHNIKTITNPGWLHLQWLHILFYPKIGHASKFWKGHDLKMSAIKKIGFKFIFYVNFLKLNYVVTKIFDVLSIGDNYIFILKKK